MKAKLSIIWDLAKKSFQEWNNDNAAQDAAAIAYYTIFSIPPLLIIALVITGLIFNTVTTQNELLAQIRGFIGPEAANLIKSLLTNSTQSPRSPITTIISIVVLLAGASGVFTQIQYALNKIWDVPQKHPSGFRDTLKKHFLSYVMVLVIGLLLLAFLMLSGFISLIIGYINAGAQNMFLPEALNFVVLLAMITILFAIIYRLIPDKEITWTDVWLGSTVTALLFMIGRYAIGFYLSISKFGSAYGAAGSLIFLLLWIYYEAQIFLFGAEFTRVFSRKFGSRAGPEVNPKSERVKTPN